MMVMMMVMVMVMVMVMMVVMGMWVMLHKQEVEEKLHGFGITMTRFRWMELEGHSASYVRMRE